jgi:hypothetical protein
MMTWSVTSCVPMGNKQTDSLNHYRKGKDLEQDGFQPNIITYQVQQARRDFAVPAESFGPAIASAQRR